MGHGFGHAVWEEVFVGKHQEMSENGKEGFLLSHYIIPQGIIWNRREKQVYLDSVRSETFKQSRAIRRFLVSRPRPDVRGCLPRVVHYLLHARIRFLFQYFLP